MGTSPDVIVVGAGVAGAASAYFLACAGAKVLLLESEWPGAGASGRNPGFLWLQSKAAGLPLDVSLTGRAFQEALGEVIGDFGFRACGGLTFFRGETLRSFAEVIVTERRQAGLSASLLDGDALRSICPALDEDIQGAIWNPADAHQDTRRLVSCLVSAAQVAGAEVRFPARVTSLIMRGEQVDGVVLDDGDKLGAGQTVLCAGLFSAHLARPLGIDLPLRPVRYEAAESSPAPFSLEPVICGPGVLRHASLPSALAVELNETLCRSEPVWPPGSFFTHQAARYGDGRIQYGAFASEGVAEAVPTEFGQSQADATWRRDLPDLAALSVERRWAGIVAQTPDYLPLIDLSPGVEGLALNCGHAFGNVIGALSGRMLAAGLSGETPPFPLAPFALRRFAGNRSSS